MKDHLWTTDADPNQVLCLYCGKTAPHPTADEWLHILEKCPERPDEEPVPREWLDKMTKEEVQRMLLKLNALRRPEEKE